MKWFHFEFENRSYSIHILCESICFANHSFSIKMKSNRNVSFVSMFFWITVRFIGHFWINAPKIECPTQNCYKHSEFRLTIHIICLLCFFLCVRNVRNKKHSRCLFFLSRKFERQWIGQKRAQNHFVYNVFFFFFWHRENYTSNKRERVLLFDGHHVWFFLIWCWILPHQWTTLWRQMKTSRNLIVEFIRLEIRNVNLFLFGYIFLSIYVLHFPLLPSLSLYVSPRLVPSAGEGNTKH